ncbi:MAG: hypothetical protein NTV34_02550 [Proteobacteria bacterium]|nr:hypothetical protein [Pseudomonadota bacterium]
MSDRPDNHAFKNTILKYGSNMTNPLLLGRSAFIIGAILFGVVACKREEKFPDLGDRFAAPIDVAADETGNYFYVLSSDDSRDYNTGSIVTLSRDGDKLAVTPTPRLGRSLSVAGNDLLVTYSNTGEGAGSRLDLYDITDPKKLKMSVSWPLNDCNPINAVMRSGYNYFAVSCSNGQIYIGGAIQEHVGHFI